MKRNILSFIVLVAMLLGLVSSAIAAPSPSTTEQPKSQSSQVIATWIYFTTQAELNDLAARFDIIEINQEQKSALVILSPDEYASLEQSGYRLEVDQGKTASINKITAAVQDQGLNVLFPCYRTVEETYTDLHAIVDNHPDMAELIDIGDSWDKFTFGGNPGYDILALRLSNENFGMMSAKPTFFLMAEIHAREYVTAETAMRYAEYLINNYGIDPDVTWMLDYFRVYIVTMTNPDGRKKAETGLLWRKNVDNNDGCNDPTNWGTDLNRNHSFKWNTGGSDYDPCGETYHGPTAGSEPEVQAIESFVQTLFPDQRGPGDYDAAPADATGLFLTLHSASGLVLWPWGWRGTPAPNGTQLQTMGRKIAYFNGYIPEQSYQLYQTSGTSDDFAYGVLGVAGYTIEQGTEFFQSCSSFESTVYPDNRDALLWAFKAARHPYIDPAGPEILSVLSSPAAVEPGDQVLLTATADDTRFNNIYGTEPTQNINEARYSIDSPSWITDTVTYPMTASDGLFDEKVEGIQATIETTELAVGRHTVFVEGKDASGKWGVPSATFIYVVEPGVSPVIEGYVRDGSTNAPLAATVSDGFFNTTTNPATGFYSMTVISGTYDLVVQADNYSPGYANGLVAQDYETVQQDILLYPYCNLFSDDVENGNQGWTAQSPWAITTSSSHSPTHSWTDSPAGNYGYNINTSLSSQSFDFSGYTGMTLDFSHKYATEAYWDYAAVEYSTDGLTWHNVTSYSGSHTTWSQVQLSIPQLDRQPHGYIRFNLTSDENTSYDGWYIDDISLQAGGPGCVDILVPTADFSSNSPVELGQPLSFANLTTGTPPITYTWEFGDGVGTSTETNPTYTYPDVGTFNVVLTATSSYGTSVKQHKVTVNPVSLKSVDLVQVTNGPLLTGTVVDFSADLAPDNAGKPYDYQVDFGDGNVADGSSSLDPFVFDHVYAHPGRYSVIISVQNTGMAEPITDSLEVLVLFQNFLPITAK